MKKLVYSLPQSVILYTVVGIFAIFLWSCKETLLLNESNQEFAVEIRYGQKVTSYQEMNDPDDVEKASIAMKMAMVPVVLKEKVRIGIYEDGSSNWEITRIPTDKENTENGLPTWKSDIEAKTIRYYNNKAMYFDDNGKLLYEMDIPTPRYDGLIAILKGEVKGRESLNNTIYKTTSVGDEIIKSYDSLIVVQNSYNDEALGMITEINVVDTITGLILGGALYNSNGEMLSKCENFYSYLTDELTVPVSEYQQVFDETADELPYTYNILTEYSDYEFINNLN